MSSFRPIATLLEKEIAENPNGTKVLDKGFIKVIDYMGNDDSICNSARISYSSATKRANNTNLINRLMKDSHTSPFESCEIQFHIKMPIFVARQIIRHRTANLNEISARYSVLDSDFFIPEPDALKVQSKANKQGRDEAIPIEDKKAILDLIDSHNVSSYALYEKLLNTYDLSRELSRMVLPINIYTQWYWKIDLHNMFHLLKLRLDPHAQLETREYAQVLAKYVKLWCPIAYNAFEVHKLNISMDEPKPSNQQPL
jgi:thymidylate synthase (FAD)